jgi:signal transduction histidine kinase
VRIIVRDNGIGIAQDHLVKIFTSGFTTKKDGHGFGLHSSANAAREMGGSLTAQSDGLGRGASFILELPVAARKHASAVAAETI